MSTQNATLDPITGQAAGFRDAVERIFNNVTNSLEYRRTPTVYKYATLTTTGNVWTPASGKKFRLMYVQYQLPEDCTISGGAELTVKLQDGAGNDIGINFLDYLPNAVPASATGDNHTILYLPGNGYLSTTANNVLVANFSVALTAGHIGFQVGGTEE